MYILIFLLIISVYCKSIISQVEERKFNYYNITKVKRSRNITVITRSPTILINIAGTKITSQLYRNFGNNSIAYKSYITLKYATFMRCLHKNT